MRLAALFSMLVVACGGETLSDLSLEAVNGTRPSVGRLTGELEYARFGSTPRAGTELLARRYQQLGASLKEARGSVRAELEPAYLAARARVSLLLARPDDAIADLQAAYEKDRRRSGYLASDLAAAYLTRSESRGSSLDLLRALQYGELAIAHEAGVEALFTHALVLTRLHLRDLALHAWERYLELAPEDGWSREAREHRARFTSATREERWRSRLEKDLERWAHGNLDDLDDLVLSFPSRSRRHAFELLTARWSSAYLRGDLGAARQSVATGRALAASLARVTLDRWLLEVARSVEPFLRDLSTDGESAAELHELLAEAKGLYRRQRHDEASAALAVAVAGLERLDSPLALSGRMTWARCRFHDNAADGRRAWQALESSVPADLYPWLAGRVQLFLGLVDAVQNREGAAVQRYSAAARLFENVADPDEKANLQTLIAGAYDVLGDVERSWAAFLKALEALSVSGDLYYYQGVLVDAEQALRRQGRADLAHVLADENVRVAEAMGDEMIAAFAFRERGTNRVDLGDVAGAFDDLQRARRAALAMPDTPRRREILSSIELEEARVSVERDPAAAVAGLTRVLGIQRALGRGFHDTRILVDRARAHRRLGDLQAERADLVTAVETWEQRRTTATEPSLRLYAFQPAQSAFDRLIDCLLPEDPESAFTWSERARARYLQDLRRAPGTEAAPARAWPGPGQVAELLPPGVTVLHYTVLEHDLVIWRLDRRDATFTRRSIARGELRDLAERFRVQLEHRRPLEEIVLSAASLYDALIRPLPPAGDTETLVVVPDRSLAAIPFGALFDRAAASYLLETWSVVVAPSLSILLEGSGKGPEVEERSAPGDVLVVAAGDVESSTRHGLPHLPGARDEGKSVADLYQESVFLEGPRATPAALLEAGRSAEVIHVASHAVANATEARRSALVLAASAEHPDGLLSVDELIGESLRSVKLLILSSCRSADGLRVDRENLLGLAGAFLGSGVRTVIASHWNADDAAARELMVRFHEARRRGRNAPQALRQAALDLLRSADQRLASPAEWGAFSCFGAPFSVR